MGLRARAIAGHVNLVRHKFVLPTPLSIYIYFILLYFILLI